MSKTVKIVLAGFIILIGIMSGSCNIYAYETVKIAIDPGHGGMGEEEKGACYNGMEEKNVNLAIANALKRELEQYGNVEAFLTRTNDDFISIEDRVNIAISQGANYIVSVHNNASTNHLFFGSEIFVPSNGDLYCKGYSMAYPIMQRWETSGCVSKGIKTRLGNNGDYYGIIRMAAEYSVPAIILEHAYIDNDNDLDKINNEYNWEKFGRLDAEGIAEYLGLQKNYVKESIMENIITNTSGVVKNDTTGPVNVEFEIESYNSKTGSVEFTISAKENESRCMFYSVSTALMTDEDGKEVPDVESASLWDGDDSVSGKIKVRKGYSGSLYAAVYNNYNIVSDVVEVDLSEYESNDEAIEYSDDEDLDSVTIDSDDDSDDSKRKKRKSRDDAEEDSIEESDGIIEELVTTEDSSEDDIKAETYNKVDPSLYSNLYKSESDEDEKSDVNTLESRQQTLNKMMFAFVVAMTALLTGCLIIAIFVQKNKDK